MMKLPLTVLILGLTTLLWSDESTKLPADAERVIERLEKFESDKYAEVQKEIRNKRQEVAKYLKTLLDRETKMGKLESALAIKNKIEALTESNVSPGKPAEDSAADFDITSTVWKAHSGPDTNRSIEFLEDGKMKIHLGNGGGWHDWKWQSLGDNTYSIKNPQHPAETITVKWKKFLLSGQPGKEPTEFRFDQRLRRFEVVFEEGISWADAEKAAKKKGGKLAIPQNEAEQKTIIQKANGMRIWIGAEWKRGKWPDEFDNCWAPDRPAVNPSEIVTAISAKGWVNLAPKPYDSVVGYVVVYE